MEIISVGNQFGLLQKQSLRQGLLAGECGGGGLIPGGWSEARVTDEWRKAKHTCAVWVLGYA